jgi:hypothetical protein
LAIGINWGEVWAPVWKSVWTQTPPTIVPDVVGLSEADATTAVEAEGLTVTVTTAYSASIAVGLVISQDPIAGSSVTAGSAVTITVSLGPEPAADSRTPAGGYDIFRKRSRADDDRDEDKRELRALIDAALTGDKPLSKATAAVIKAEPAVVASVPATDLSRLLAEVRDSRARLITIEKLEKAIAAAEHRARILKDDDELLELLGASGLLQ